MSLGFAEVIGRQRSFFLTGATRSLEFRRAQLARLREGLEAHEAALLGALHADLRKSPVDAYATEVGLVMGEIGHARRHLGRWMRPERRGTPWFAWPARGEVRSEPHGVALILGPWNYPCQLMLSPLVGALAAGNCAVLKPSEHAPRTAGALEQMVKETFPAEVVTVVSGGRETAEALLVEQFDVVFFTGSSGVGRAVMGAAARHLTPVILELGGKSPCLVAADAPLGTSARRIAWGKFLNAGQTCVAPDHILVDRRVAGALIEALRGAIRAFYGEDPQRSPDYGRIINRAHFDRLTGYLAEGRIVHGGGRDAADLYLEPTILADVPPGSKVMREEIFGPILPVMVCEGMDEAVAMLRGRPIPLALYLFTRDRGLQERVLAATQSGGVCVNDTVVHMIGAGLPFGGQGESGMGAYHGRSGFESFSHRRPVMRRALGFDPRLRYPPTQLTLAAMKRALRYLLCQIRG
ncbi:MAG TPA: aldehyde dehydrogenase family protein [Verrucomicrobiota bacterium]|nr:aldehyde dehydrogenase family protein [Verrucomicrobiota bacterium]HNU51303.1 aldehyde dehydrogenase family protein [Verrucomicrobiota bacterium]